MLLDRSSFHTVVRGASDQLQLQRESA